MQGTIALQKRLEQAARSIPGQHRKLREMLGELMASVRNHDLPAVHDLLDHLRPAITAHFALEENVFFPVMQDLHPDLEDRFRDLLRDHEQIRAELSALDQQLGSRTGNGSPAMNEAVRSLAKAVSTHEKQEEDLVNLARVPLG